jgi:hypothetical protein
MAKGEWKETSEFIDKAVEILEAEHPMTVRQLFYRLVSAGVIENTKDRYQYVSRMMTKARRDDRCPYEWLVDRSRPTYRPYAFENPAAYAETVKRNYRKDYWATQPRYCEIWCEKDAVTGSIEDTCDLLGVTLRVSRGFMSATRQNDIAQHFLKIKKPITVFYLGDHDPSGRAIESTAETAVSKRMYCVKQNCPAPTLDDAVKMLESGWSNFYFDMKRLAIHQSDITTFNLPPLKVKDTDSRTEDFVKKHGGHCVELDALPPTELRSRIEDAVNELLDPVAWNRAIAIEKVELASIVEIAGKWTAIS